MNPTMDWKVRAGYWLGSFAFVGMLVAAWVLPGLRVVNYLVIVAFGLAGWTLGILLSPDDRTQEKRFQMWLASIGAFLAGLVVGKLEDVVQKSADSGVLFGDMVLGRILLAIGALCLGALVTFIGRIYVR